MRRSRRIFLGVSAVAVGALALGYARLTRPGEEERLLTDPEAREFVFRGGWLEQV